MVDFKKLLDKPIETEAKRPPTLPQGTYFGVVTKWEPGESAQKKTPYVRLHIQLTEGGSDVESELASNPDIDLTKKQMRRDYYLTADAEYRLHEMLKSFGIEPVGQSYNEMLAKLVGQDAMVTVIQKQNATDPTQPPFNEITDLKAKPE